jgi:16S rRNA (cytosine967-C5)-methyltransferase
MTPSARLSAAIEVLDDLITRRRPASDAMKDWGLAHRFAGSGDRAAISGLVYDALRRRASSAWIMGAETPRAVLLGSLHLERGMTAESIAALCDGERFAPERLSDSEITSLKDGSLDDAPPHVKGDYPEWLDSQFFEAFGEARAEELEALTHRAPVDMRVNTLKATPDAVGAQLQHLHCSPTPFSPVGLRIVPNPDGRAPSVQAEPAFQKGLFEIQDEGSQLVAQLAAPDPGMQVIDLCAGGGGKTLALAALMDNRGQIFSTDSDKRRLAPIFDRLTRAGARNVQVRAPRGKDDEPLEGLDLRADLVVVDAPCTGTGTWRRNPDAKWRLRPNALEDRLKEQAIVLDRAARYVKPGGILAYITCSLLPVENDGAVEQFLSRHSGFTVKPSMDVAEAAGLGRLADFASVRGLGLQLTPRRTGTDGFYISLLQNTDH